MTPASVVMTRMTDHALERARERRINLWQVAMVLDHGVPRRPRHAPGEARHDLDLRVPPRLAHRDPAMESVEGLVVKVSAKDDAIITVFWDDKRT